MGASGEENGNRSAAGGVHRAVWATSREGLCFLTSIVFSNIQLSISLHLNMHFYLVSLYS